MATKRLGSRRWLALIGLVVLLLVLASATVAYAAWRWLDTPMPLAQARVEVTIAPGSTAREAAQAWVAAGVQVSPRWLFEWFRWSGQAKRIRAGSFQAGEGVTPRRLLAMMVQGEVVTEQVRLIEGWTFRQLRAELARAPHLRPDSAALSDAELMAALGEPGVSPEGRFYPDTYVYGRGDSDLAVLRRAHRAMRERLQAAWSERLPDSPLKTPDEALVLASIIEKETGIAAERPQIGGVFVNRLRLGMPLQTDPTVIFGLGAAFDGNLRKRDLLADTPYNTYTRSGLPPTPIALPGLASLRAAVRPQETKALFFVARGDGSSEFSATLTEHNRAVNRYQRGGR